MLFGFSMPFSIGSGASGAVSMKPKGNSVDSGTIPQSIYGFEVIDFLGEGAASVIYAVSDPRNQQIYALKHVIVKNEKQVRFVDQLVNEFKISQEIDHPYVRKCVDMKVSKSLLRKTTEAALIMELVQGTPVETRPPSNIQTSIAVFRQTATALKALHDKGFVHCDLKPNNILRTPGGHVKLIDLGQACAIGSVKKRIQGTPDYMAPEQVRCEPMTVQTDVYNFGATLYWTLTGKTLPTLFTIKKSSNSFLLPEAVPTPRDLNGNVPEGLSNLTMECVRTTAERRPADMNELIRRLEVIGGTLPAS
jgi:serine/threonine protein kinase